MSSGTSRPNPADNSAEQQGPELSWRAPAPFLYGERGRAAPRLRRWCGVRQAVLYREPTRGLFHLDLTASADPFIAGGGPLIDHRSARACSQHDRQVLLATRTAGSEGLRAMWLDLGAVIWNRSVLVIAEQRIGVVSDCLLWPDVVRAGPQEA